jgi:hypothetical protein
MQDVLQLAYNQLTKLYEEANSAAKASHNYAKAQKTLQELSDMVNPVLHDLEYIDSSPFYVVEGDKRPDFLMLKSQLLFADDDALAECEEEETLSLTACCGLNRVRVSREKVDEVPCMVTLQAKDSNTRTEYRDLVCVFDQSARMADPLISLMKDTLMGIIEKLGDTDRISLVGYSEEADRKCPLIKCTAAGKEKLVQLITALNCKGEACILKGLLTGTDVLKQRRMVNKTTKLLLFSGINSILESENEQGISILMQEEIPNATVYTFEYGEGASTNLLEALAKQGKGSFYHITEQPQIAGAIVRTLCDSNTVIARNISVSLRAVESSVPCKITRLYPRRTFNPVHLPDHLASEKEQVILYLLRPQCLPLEAEALLPTIRIILKYEESNGVHRQQTAIQEINFVQWEGKRSGLPVNRVYLSWYRATGEDFLEEAAEESKNGKYTRASTIIANGIRRLHSSGYAELPEIQRTLRKLMQLSESIKIMP